MSVLMKGNIIDFIPFFRGSLDENNKLVISDDGDLFLTVDTGFSGGIALPLDVLTKLEVELAFYDTLSDSTDTFRSFGFSLRMIDIGLRLIKELRTCDKITVKDLESLVDWKR